MTVKQDMMRLNVVKQVARNKLEEAASRCNLVKNQKLHFSPGNAKETQRELQTVLDLVNEVNSLVLNYSTDPETTIKRLLNLED